LSSWLYRVSFRIAVQAKLDARRRQERERRGGGMRASRGLERAEAGHSSFILEEGDRLAEGCRVPLVPFGFEGMTRAGAAQYLGCPVGTVRGRLSRAREILQARLTRRGVTIPASLLVAGMAPRTAYPAVPPALLVSTVEASLKILANGAIASSI